MPPNSRECAGQIAEHCLPRQANQARPNNHSHPSERTIDQVLSYLAGRKGGLRRLKQAARKLGPPLDVAPAQLSFRANARNTAERPSNV
jgi:hypothetical protein